MDLEEEDDLNFCLISVTKALIWLLEIGWIQNSGRTVRCRESPCKATPHPLRRKAGNLSTRTLLPTSTSTAEAPRRRWIYQPFWSPTRVAAALCAVRCAHSPWLGGRPVSLLRSAGNDGKSVRKLAKKVRQDLGDGPACLATTTFHEAQNKFIVNSHLQATWQYHHHVAVSICRTWSVDLQAQHGRRDPSRRSGHLAVATWRGGQGRRGCHPCWLQAHRKYTCRRAPFLAGRFAESRTLFSRRQDAAWIYGNEEEVGQGIKASGVARSELFVTTKIWGTYHRQPEACLDESLQKLGLDYVDLVLVHWPVPLEKRGDEKIPLNPDGSRALDRDWTPEQTWEQMEKLPATGKAKAIGVSNWSVPYLERLLAKAKTVPAANQVELHPFLPQHELVKFCQSKGILMQAYSPLGSSGGPVLQDELVKSIAKAHSADPAQVVVSWAAQRGVVALPKSVTPSRIETNHKLITLSDDEMLKLNELHQQEGKSVRLVSPNWGVDLECSRLKEQQSELIANDANRSSNYSQQANEATAALQRQRRQRRHRQHARFRPASDRATLLAHAQFLRPQADLGLGFRVHSLLIMVADRVGTSSLERRAFEGLHGVGGSASSQSRDPPPRTKVPVKINVPRDGSTKHDDDDDYIPFRPGSSKRARPARKSALPTHNYSYRDNLDSEGTETAIRTGSHADRRKQAQSSRSPRSQHVHSPTDDRAALHRTPSHTYKSKAKARERDPASAQRPATRSRKHSDNEPVVIDDSDDDEPVPTSPRPVSVADDTYIAPALQTKDRKRNGATTISPAAPNNFYFRNNQRPDGPLRLEGPNEPRRSIHPSSHSKPMAQPSSSNQRPAGTIASRMKPKNPSPEASSQPSHRLPNGSAARESTSSRQHGNSGERAFASDTSPASKRRRTDKLHDLPDGTKDDPLGSGPLELSLDAIVVSDIWRSQDGQQLGARFIKNNLYLFPAHDFILSIRYTDIGQVEHSDDDVLEHAILSITLRQGSESVKRLLEFFPAFDPHASQEASEIHLIARGVRTNVEALIAAAALMRRAMGDECKFSYLPPPSTATKIRAVTSVKAKPWPKPTSLSHVEASIQAKQQKTTRTAIRPGEGRRPDVDASNTPSYGGHLSPPQPRKKTFDIQAESPKSKARATFDVDMRDASSPSPDPELPISVRKGKRATLTRTRVQTRSASNAASHEPMLQYPYEGIGAVTLLRSDYDRLYDGQLLNDTVIEFGLKVLFEDICARNPELASSMYMFNTFFFNKLLTEGTVETAYRKLRKWTSKVDLFSKKYIVVPINENYHWYLALIVNPGHMLTVHGTDGDRDHEIGSDGEKEQVASALDTAPKASAFLSPGGEWNQSKPWQEEDAILTPPLAPLVIPTPSRDARVDTVPAPMDLDADSRASTPSKGASPSVDLSQTFLIIFDSLEGEHKNVDKKLYEYLWREALDKKRISPALFQKLAEEHAARAKRNAARNRRPLTRAQQQAHQEADIERAAVDVDAASPATGATESPARKIQVLDTRQPVEAEEDRPTDEELAKCLPKLQYILADVPIQPNFCDCGIYMLHYFDRFFREPERLLTMMLENRGPRTLTGKVSASTRNKQKRVQKHIIEAEWQAGEVSGKRQYWRNKADELSELWKEYELQKQQYVDAVKQDGTADDEDMDVEASTPPPRKDLELGAQTDALGDTTASAPQAERGVTDAESAEEPTVEATAAHDEARPSGETALGDAGLGLDLSQAGLGLEESLEQVLSGRDSNEIDQILQAATEGAKGDMALETASNEQADVGPSSGTNVKSPPPLYEPFRPLSVEPGASPEAAGAAESAQTSPQQRTPVRFGSGFIGSLPTAQSWQDVSPSMERTHYASDRASRDTDDTDAGSSTSTPIGEVGPPSISSSVAVVDQI
ncbi:aldo/keto reductase family proteins [Moesziomyces antarcticus T-34]|uniref:Aldo/keto reductase family proteins n=1 Tax=Pseudozyma antarctica (strain T-34) TaxID=1151754 RepID=M9LNX4_PSEA3|nr:aldo/keto reductase family proteins [Moesziomyces antarcticus T-34]